MGAIAQGVSPNSSPTENAHLAGSVPAVSHPRMVAPLLAGQQVVPRHLAAVQAFTRGREIECTLRPGRTNARRRKQRKEDFLGFRSVRQRNRG